MVEHNPGAFSVIPEIARINTTFGPSRIDLSNKRLLTHAAIAPNDFVAETAPHVAEDLGITDPIYQGLFPEQPALDFEPLPPPHPSKLDGKPAKKFDLSGIKPHENGNLRIFANYTLPFSPSETSPEVTRILRAMVRQEMPKPVGYISYEADVDPEIVISFLFPEDEINGSNTAFNEIVEVYEESPDNPSLASGEIYVAMPKLREFVLEVVEEMEIFQLGYTHEELLQIQDNLRVLNVLPNSDAIFSQEATAAD